MAKILIVEDDQIYAQNTRDWLEMHQHTVELAHTGSDALNKLAVSGFDLLIVDFQLPDMIGPDIVREIRRRSIRTPVLMLTVRQMLNDKEAGFDAGADDYLDKAVHPKELTLRLVALLRRPTTYMEPIRSFGDLVLNQKSGGLMRGGQPIHLLPKEYALMSFLFSHPERVFSAEELLEKVWPSESEATPHTVRSCINRIRAKLDSPDLPSVISTVRGLGYGLNQEFSTATEPKNDADESS